ncbi:MAG: fatty acid desaturase family protein [Bacteroidota bacterium]
MAHTQSMDQSYRLDKAQLQALYQTKPHLHAFHMFLNWVFMLGTAYLCSIYFNPFTYILAVVIIGARMHALAILMHDATHFRFLNNRKLNDAITNWTSMYPLYTSIEQYRPNHLKHHNNLNTEEDPDWFAKLGKKEFTFPKSKGEFLKTVLSYFTLVQGIKDSIWFVKRFSVAKVKNQSKKKSRSLNIQRISFYIILVIALSVLGLWKEYLMYWVIPYLSTFFMFQYIRSVAEHFGELAYDHDLSNTRTIITNPLEKFFFAPHNVSYHLEHHLYPGVPYYHLEDLHDLLMEKESYSDKAHITQGFVSGLMNELGNKKLTALA